MRAWTLSTVISSDMKQTHLVSRTTDPGLLSRGREDPGPSPPQMSNKVGPGSPPDQVRGRPGHENASRCDNHLADHLTILDQTQPLARLLERQHLVDHWLHLALLDQLHQTLQVLVVEAVRADDLELEAPHVAQV